METHGPWVQLMARDVVMSTVEGDSLAGQQAFEDVYGLRQTRHAGRATIESKTSAAIFAVRISGAESEVNASVGQ